MRAKWVLSLVVAGGLVAALIVFVDNNQNNAPYTALPQHVAETKREDTILVEQDQAPRKSRLAQRARPGAGIAAAVAADMRRQISEQSFPGPLNGVRCAAVKPLVPTRLPFNCTGEAAYVNYPYVGVVDTSARTITICKHDIPPQPGINIPDSPLCLP
jgi:hypothetical protein